MRSLYRHRPSGIRPRTLVHGGFRNGNVIIGPDGIRAVLDWEVVHVGDPAEDLGWLCARWNWRRSADEPVNKSGAC